ncbi:MAG: hypothetical protein R2708_17355 [Vicinamibacterales bacterium]
MTDEVAARGSAESTRSPGRRPGRTYVGKRGFTYGAGASAETVGAERICMNVPMPPGAKAEGALPDRIETIAYLLEGECVVCHGDRLRHRALVGAGDRTNLRCRPMWRAPCTARQRAVHLARRALLEP